MKKPTLMLVAIAALALTACIPSLNPFYTARDVVFDPALIGEWTSKDSGDQSDTPDRWTFERIAGEDNDAQGYHLTVTDGEGKQGEFKATLFQLKDHRFLDLIPEDCEYATNQSDLVAFAMFPGHLLIHVKQIEPELKMAFSDFDWLAKHLEDHPKALVHHQEDERILLTASTKQLQRFVLKHVEGGELFPDYGEMTKPLQPTEPTEDK